MRKIIHQEDKKIANLNLLLKEKEQEVRIAKQKAGFFARKHAEVLEKLGKAATDKKERKNLSLGE